MALNLQISLPYYFHTKFSFAGTRHLVWIAKGEFLIEEVVEIRYGGEIMGRKSGAKEYEGGTKSAPLAADISGPIHKYRHCKKKRHFNLDRHGPTSW